MSNPTKKDPHWKFNMEIIKEINRTSPIYKSTPEEFAETCLFEQMAIRAKELRMPVRKAYAKMGIYFDLKALAMSLNIPVQGSLRDVFIACIAISPLANGAKNGKEEEFIYLESVYYYLLKLKSLDEGLYSEIVGKIDKKTKKWGIFQDYIIRGSEQLLK